MADDIDSAFERIVMAEERLVEQGFQEGLQEGNASGYEKGFALGVKHGAEISQELGFYSGFAQTWLKLLDTTETGPTNISNIKSVLNALLKLVEDFPRHEPQNVNIQRQLVLIRAKFKQSLNGQHKQGTPCHLKHVSNVIHDSEAGLHCSDALTRVLRNNRQKTIVASTVTDGHV